MASASDAAAVRYFPRPGGGRIAYRLSGRGAPLVVIPPWVYDMQTQARRFIGPLRPALGRRGLLLYDRLGTGLSDRRILDWRFERHADELVDLLDHLRLQRVAVCATSQAGPVAIDFAARYPERAARLLLVSTYASGPEIFTRPRVRQSMVELVRAHWGIASKVLADMLMPGASAAEAETLAADQRRSADAPTAARMLEEIYAADVSGLLETIRAPALVVHHRGDRAIPFAGGAALASRLPGARLLPIEGRGHALVDFDRHPGVLREMSEFLSAPAETVEATGDSAMLTQRQREVLRLVAEGKSNAEIAAELVISVNTVANHIRGALERTGASNRAAAAAYAVRQGLI